MMQHGYSLIETLVGLMLLSIITTLAYQGFSFIASSREGSMVLSNLYHTVLHADMLATWRGHAIMIVPVNEDWSNGWSVVDHGITLKQQPALTYGILKWRGFGSSSALTRLPVTQHQTNGTFVYCPVHTSDCANHQALVLSTTGTARLADTNQQGCPVNSSGTPLTCS
jgi:prepilin-type N-terminal cleavage/methylation domain-containing protein